MGWSGAQADEGPGVTRRQLYKAINCHGAISPEMAVRLEKSSAARPDAWLGMQAAYDLAQVRLHAGQIVRPLTRNRHEHVADTKLQRYSDYATD